MSREKILAKLSRAVLPGLLSCLLSWAGMAFAQAPTATLVGQVVDSSKAEIVGATVEARDTSTNQVRTARTGPQGEYTISALTPGIYDVTISMTGFRQLNQTSLQLSASQTARLNATLELGTVSETVTVSSEVGLLNTETSSKGEVIAPVEIAQIPLNGRDFNDLAFTVAGVQPAEQSAKGSAYVVNGSRADSSNVLIDGINDESPRDAGAQISPPLDSMQEFKLDTSGYSAQYGRLSGGVVNLLLKSGGNHLHGSLFEFVRNDFFDAHSYFDLPGTRSELRRNQFGGTLTGPVFIPHIYDGHDRTFFMFSWESFRGVSGNNQIGFVPTALERNGNFSQTMVKDSKGNLVPLLLKKPSSANACTTTAPSNCLPCPPSAVGCVPGTMVATIDPIALKLLGYYPLPNVSLPGGNYQINLKNSSSWDNFVGKIDQKLTSKDQFAVRVLRRNSASSNPFTGSGLGTFGARTTNNQTLIGISETRIFTPTLINEFRVGLTRTTNNQISNDAGTNFAAQLGIPGTTTIPALEGFPTFKMTGYHNIGDSATYPITYVVNDYDLNDLVTWNKGKHTIKIGGDVLHVQYFQPSNSNYNGAFSFNGKFTGNALADLLVGVPTTSTLKTGTVNNHLLNSNYSVFVQDDYKVTPNLTLNLGLRYEFPTLPTEENGQLSNYLPSAQKVILSSVATVPNVDALIAKAGLTPYVGLARDYHLPSSLVNSNKNMLSPRIGFAARPLGNDRLVVRGGYGIFYTGTRLSAIRTDLAGGFPYSVTQVSTSTVATSKAAAVLVSLSNPFDPAFQQISGTNTTTGFDTNAPSSYLQSYNLTIERDLGMGFGLEAGYVGSKGTHLGQAHDLNQEMVRDVATSRPYPYFGNIKFYSFDGISHYDSAQVTLRRRFQHGLFLRANYTFGKSLDTSSGFNYAGAGGYFGHQNNLAPWAEYGRSDFDIRHNFSGTLIYQVPRTANFLVREWQIASTTTVYSGQPFTPVVGSASQDFGEATRPNRTCQGSISNPTPAKWFDVTCFPQVPAGSAAFGNSGRNILDGPKAINVNASVSRGFSFRDYGQLQFRWEVFDVLNHPNFALPNDSVDQTSAGTINSVNSNRVMQLGARYQF